MGCWATVVSIQIFSYLSIGKMNTWEKWLCEGGRELHGKRLWRSNMEYPGLAFVFRPLEHSGGSLLFSQRHGDTENDSEVSVDDSVDAVFRQYSRQVHLVDCFEPVPG